MNLILSGRRCLVIGGGTVAAHKIKGLLACEAIVHVIATHVCDEIKTLGVSQITERPYATTDIQGYRLIVSATNDPLVNRKVYEDGEAAGIWVNSADDPASCAFTLPSVVRRGPLMVAMSTGGHSPAFATWMRKHVEGEVGPEYEQLLELLSQRRAEMKQLGHSTEAIDWSPIFDGTAIHMLSEGNESGARARILEVTEVLNPDHSSRDSRL